MRSVRRVRYRVDNVSRLEDLLVMMRYDRMMLSEDGTEAALIELIDRIRQPGVEPAGIVVERWQDTHWQPSVDRWRSFGMTIEAVDEWARCREV